MSLNRSAQMRRWPETESGGWLTCLGRPTPSRIGYRLGARSFQPDFRPLGRELRNQMCPQVWLAGHTKTAIVASSDRKGRLAPAQSLKRGGGIRAAPLFLCQFGFVVQAELPRSGADHGRLGNSDCTLSDCPLCHPLFG